MKTGHSSSRADKEVLAWNSILNENAGETISVSPLKMSRVLLRVACSAERERERENSKAYPSVCERIFHYFDVTPFLRMREISEASFSLLAR